MNKKLSTSGAVIKMSLAAVIGILLATLLTIGCTKEIGKDAGALIATDKASTLYQIKVEALEADGKVYETNIIAIH